MAIKIKMLKKRFIPVLNQMGEVDEVVKVNNEVGHELVKEGDAEYLNPEFMNPFKEKRPRRETAAIDPNENEIIPRGEFKKPARWSNMKKGK